MQDSAKTDTNVDFLLSSPCLNTYGWEKKLLEGREELETFLYGEYKRDTLNVPLLNFTVEEGGTLL